MSCECLFEPYETFTDTHEEKSFAGTTYLVLQILITIDYTTDYLLQTVDLLRISILPEN